MTIAIISATGSAVTELLASYVRKIIDPELLLNSTEHQSINKDNMK